MNTSSSPTEASQKLATVYTIGFTQKSAERFFGLLRSSNARRIVDVRLNNVSQLAGFAKRQDLSYFLREICQMDYVHLPDLAPTQEMLDGYKKRHGTWLEYENKFLELLAHRKIERTVSRDLIEGGCLLCSEHDARHCHRRLVAEYLSSHWDVPLKVEHLK